MASGVTTVDCEKQVRSWRLLRSFMQLLIPTCNCATIIEDQDVTSNECHQTPTKYYSPSLMMSSTTITGTIFGYRRGKVSFCIQENANSNPILLVELAVPTTILAKEMRGGALRIALESDNDNSDGSNNNNNTNTNTNTLLSTPLWTMYCNGRKVGYAVKRRPSNTDFEALRLMSSIVVGTGMIKCKELVKKEDEDGELIYLRGRFQRVRGSDKSESFHLIDPEGDMDQELSVFFFRSR